MNLKNEFNRLSDYFSGSMGKMHTVTDDLTDTVSSRAWHLGERARDGFRTSKDSLMSIEEMMVGHVRKNPSLYLFAGLLLVGAIISKMMFYSDRRSTMMRHEW